MAEPFRKAKEAEEIAEAYQEDTAGRSKLRRAPHPQKPRLPWDWDAPKPKPAISWDARRFIEAAKQSPTLASIYHEAYAAVEEELDGKLEAAVRKIVREEVAPLRAQIEQARQVLKRAQEFLEDVQRILSGQETEHAQIAIELPRDSLSGEEGTQHPGEPLFVPGMSLKTDTLRGQAYLWMAQKGRFTTAELKEHLDGALGEDWGGKKPSAYAASLASSAKSKGLVVIAAHQRPYVYRWIGPRPDPITGSMHRG